MNGSHTMPSSARRLWGDWTHCLPFSSTCSLLLCSEQNCGLFNHGFTKQFNFHTVVQNPGLFRKAAFKTNHSSQFGHSTNLGSLQMKEGWGKQLMHVMLYYGLLLHRNTVIIQNLFKDSSSEFTHYQNNCLQLVFLTLYKRIQANSIVFISLNMCNWLYAALFSWIVVWILECLKPLFSSLFVYHYLAINGHSRLFRTILEMWWWFSNIQVASWSSCSVLFHKVIL